MKDNRRLSFYLTLLTPDHEILCAKLLCVQFDSDVVKLIVQDRFSFEQHFRN